MFPPNLLKFGKSVSLSSSPSSFFDVSDNQKISVIRFGQLAKSYPPPATALVDHLFTGEEIQCVCVSLTEIQCSVYVWWTPPPSVSVGITCLIEEAVIDLWYCALSPPRARLSLRHQGDGESRPFSCPHPSSPHNTHTSTAHARDLSLSPYFSLHPPPQSSPQNSLTQLANLVTPLAHYISRKWCHFFSNI